MSRPVTLFSGQWADLPFDQFLRQGQVLRLRRHRDRLLGRSYGRQARGYRSKIRRGQESPPREERPQGLALGSHLAGQCVGDLWDPRLDGFAPRNSRASPTRSASGAIQEMKYTARAAKAMGCKVVTGFMGSSVWKYWYSFPQTSQSMVDDAFKEIVKLWTPIFDEFDACGVKFALEVHPTEIAFDYYTAARLLEEFKHRPTLGFNFDPSHLIWQGVKPDLFLRDFAKKVYHVHMKDAAVTLDGRAGDHRLPSRVRRQPPGLELPIPRPRGRGLREHHQGAECRGLFGAAFGRVGGLGHGARIRRQGGPGLRPQGRFRPLERGLRCRDAKIARPLCIVPSVRAADFDAHAPGLLPRSSRQQFLVSLQRVNAWSV